MSKPPLGVTPKNIWDMQRIENLKGAIDRYCNANREIPIEWIEEYNSLVNKKHTTKQYVIYTVVTDNRVRPRFGTRYEFEK